MRIGWGGCNGYQVGVEINELKLNMIGSSSISIEFQCLNVSMWALQDTIQALFSGDFFVWKAFFLLNPLESPQDKGTVVSEVRLTTMILMFKHFKV